MDSIEATTDGYGLQDFLHLLERPEDVGTTLLWKKSSAEGATDRPPADALIRKACQHLFLQVEGLARVYQATSARYQLQQKKVVPKTPTEITTLSGLTQLHCGTAETLVDAETLFGQVELQNQALESLLKKSLKILTKAADGDDNHEEEGIRLLGELESDDDDDDNRNDEDDDVQVGEMNDDDDEQDDSGDDEEKRRISDRMARVMKDMEVEDDNGENDEEDEFDEDDDDEGNHEQSKKKDDCEEDGALDPARESMRDGFFDLHEMEAFADEEEEYLPDDAYGEEKPDDIEQEDTRSFHQKQRDGDVALRADSEEEEEDDDDLEDDNNLLFRKDLSSVRRKRYREDDEIDALYRLYEAPQEDDGSDDVVNLTAADIFGKPNPSIVARWNGKKKGNDESWHDDDFDQSGWADESGWNDEDDEEVKVGNSGDDDDDDDDDDNLDIRHPDKINEGKASKNKVTSKPSKQKLDKLRLQTEQLEKEMLAEKPWQMKGEVGGPSRPVNSLLESTPEFELASKAAPIITVEHTTNLEEVIKQRILKEDWDDVIPRELPDVGWHSKKGELPEVSQEKSKLGLGELYEREYLKKAAGYDVDKAEKETEEEKAKNEMRTLFANLCSKLDALSNYHFAPRPIAEEAEIRPVTTPAIAMEEVLPLHVSDARGVAPEEVYGAKRGREGILRNDNELEQPERKRIRSSKKAARRKARKEKLADEKLISRLQPGLGLNNPYEKRKVREELSAARAKGKVISGTSDTNEYTSSGTFFQRMQAEAQQDIKSRKETASTEKKEAKRKSASALKL